MRDTRYAISDRRWAVWLLLLAFLALAVTYSVAPRRQAPQRWRWRGGGRGRRRTGTGV